MSDRGSPRNVAVIAALVAAAVGLAASATFAWKQHRGCRQNRQALAARRDSDRSLEAIADQVRGLEERRAALQTRSAEAGERLAALEKRLMPLEAGASRRLKLEILDLAAACGLAVEEVAPGLQGGLNRDPEWACPVAATPGRPAAPAGTEVGAIAFLQRLPAGDAYRRPLLSIKCRAKYDAVRRFFEGLNGLSWSVTPVSFGLGRGNEAARAPASTDVEDEGYGAGGPVRWSSADERLRLTVVLAL